MEQMDKIHKDTEELHQKAVGAPPPGLMTGFSESVYKRTTRKEKPQQAWAGRRNALGAIGALAAAGAAAVVLYPREPQISEETLAMAEIDLDLLENLDLCMDMDLLEMLEALEEIDNG